MTYGTLCCEEGRGEDNLVRIDNNKSVDVFGVRILVKEAESAVRTALLVANSPYENGTKLPTK